MPAPVGQGGQAALQVPWLGRPPADPKRSRPRRPAVRPRLPAFLLALPLLLALPSAAARAGEGAPLRVVCANTILADIVQQLGGDRVTAISLVRPGVDPHSWEP